MVASKVITNAVVIETGVLLLPTGSFVHFTIVDVRLPVRGAHRIEILIAIIIAILASRAILNGNGGSNHGGKQNKIHHSFRLQSHTYEEIEK